MEKIRNKIVFVLQLVMGLILLAMIVANFVQMVTRYFISVTVVWVEDFSVLGLYWLFSLGVPMAWLIGAHMEMNILEKVMSDKFKRVILYLTQVAGIGIGVLFIKAGKRAFDLNKGRVMSIMGFDEKWRYIPLIVCGVLMIACVAFRTVSMIREDMNKKKNTTEVEKETTV